ncbi:sugar-binding transcriptional regulator [Vagococcus sp. BWB3-3]|uniref:Sugar-binding transcriptional regulator n=1 Tax=Vagococcus allomyrinae TaxID=2794353 RepID=A0A940PE25_9ENTE|nr:sugar-binding transcriptional regulator [Vagococcus allomyrinae]MBP1043120.1 sugar-binding transcriptional regulator [Vagococcus allomyrinae]
MKLTEDHRKLLKVASLYYRDGLTQSSISKQMGISRPVISKMLQRAKEQGIVTIYLKDENAKVVDQANQLIRKYDLQDAIVVPHGGNDETTQQAVAQAAAMLLREYLPKIQSIGISWGTTLAKVVDAMTYENFSEIKIHPLVGGVASEHVHYDTNHLAFRLSEKLGASCSYLYAPALAETKALAVTLNKSQLVQEALAKARAVDFALIGVGDPQASSTWRQLGYMTAECLSGGAVIGDAIGSLFDKNGKTIDNKMTERMIGIKVEELVRIPNTLLIGAGFQKAVAIRALLQGKSANLIVIDQVLAEALLEH